MNKFEQYCKELQANIKSAYEEGVTLEAAEKLAAKFLDAGIEVGEELKVSDLDRRMKKAGLKAIKAASYLNAATQGDRKPSDKLIEAVIDSDREVSTQQELLDIAEVYVNNLENYLRVFHEAHIFFRGVSKGRFE